MTYGKWPVVLKSNGITLRPLRFRDRGKWDEVRAVNRDWLTPWEATRPLVPGESDTAELPSLSDQPINFDTKAPSSKIAGPDLRGYE